MSRSATDRRRLADAVQARRTQLKLSKDECARRAKMSNVTWTRVEEAESVRDTTYVRVDEVLEWAPGSCVEILADPEFQPVPSRAAKGARYSEPPLAEQALRQAVQNASIATVPDLTGAQIIALQEQVIEELRRQGVIPNVD
jgi:hypothetical protein